MSNTYQKTSRRAQLEPLPGEIAVPEQVIVSMTEIAGAAKEGLLALAVVTGLQVMAACSTRTSPGCAARTGGIMRTARATGTAPGTGRSPSAGGVSR